MYKLDLEHSSQHNIFKGIVNEVLKLVLFEVLWIRNCELSFLFEQNSLHCSTIHFFILIGFLI